MDQFAESEGKKSLRNVLRRGLLGKAGVQSASHYAGSDEYWDQAMAAQFDWRLPGSLAKRRDGRRMSLGFRGLCWTVLK